MNIENLDIVFKEDLVAEIKSDFLERQKNRRPYELMWQLNMNFVMGNQYSVISGRGEIEQVDKFFFWQEKQVYNHIAPIVETRLSRLSMVRPRPVVRPFSNSDSDNNSAKLATKILDSVSDQINLDELITQSTMWSEICGTSFYKVVWDKNLQVSGKKQQVGGVNVTVCPPFEIYPDSNVCQSIVDCSSIIHARVYSASDIKNIFGVDVKPEKLQVFAVDGTTGIGGLGYNSTVPSITRETKNNHALVIERYTKPDAQNKNGKLEIIAGDELVYVGDLPNSGEQSVFPFIRQTCFNQIGCFWGASVVERCIPVQRAYNATRNRKQEFLNRISMGILAVEDGSVDTDNLEEEGLSPGKIIVYRQGANRPSIMDTGSIPSDFIYEEERLLKEFTAISGVSEFATRSSAPTNVTSGVALQQLAEMDDTRMAITSDSIRSSIKNISKHILRLFKKYATTERLAKITDNKGNVEVFYFVSSDISSDDIVFETENEISDNITARRNLVMQLVASGILTDDQGKLTKSTKSKVLSMLGFGNWENSQDITQLHIERAEKENIEIDDAEMLIVDDHDLHIEEHTRFIISGEYKNFGKEYMEKILSHILAHKLAKENKYETTETEDTEQEVFEL